jgi:hypothetical protein
VRHEARGLPHSIWNGFCERIGRPYYYINNIYARERERPWDRRNESHSMCCSDCGGMPARMNRPSPNSLHLRPAATREHIQVLVWYEYRDRAIIIIFCLQYRMQYSGKHRSLHSDQDGHGQYVVVLEIYVAIVNIVQNCWAGYSLNLNVNDVFSAN